MANDNTRKIVMRALIDKYSGGATSRLTISTPTPIDFQRQQQQHLHTFSNVAFNQTTQQNRSLITASSAITPYTDSFPSSSKASCSTQEQHQLNTGYISDEDDEVPLNILKDLTPEQLQLVPLSPTPKAAAPTAISEKKIIRSNWGDLEDSSLCSEIAISNPFEFKKGSLRRGAEWRKVAEHFNNSNKSFKVQTGDSVRERFKQIKAKFLRKSAEEERASGISPEFTDFDQLVSELISRESTSNTSIDKETKEAAQKKVDSMAKRQEIMKKCTEGLSTPRAKRHRGENSNVEFLKGKWKRTWR